MSFCAVPGARRARGKSDMPRRLRNDACANIWSCYQAAAVPDLLRVCKPVARHCSRATMSETGAPPRRALLAGSALCNRRHDVLSSPPIVCPCRCAACNDAAWHCEGRRTFSCTVLVSHSATRSAAWRPLLRAFAHAGVLDCVTVLPCCLQ